MADYPLLKFHFQVEWGGSKIAFTEVTGLEVETEGVEYRVGSSREHHKIMIPGMQKLSTISLKRGTYVGDNEFYDWWNTVALNTIEKRALTISLLNQDHDPVVVWKVKQAWPTKVVSTELKADGNEIAIEQIDLFHEGLVIQND